jgi:hypothetical protein
MLRFFLDHPHPVELLTTELTEAVGHQQHHTAWNVHRHVARAISSGGQAMPAYRIYWLNQDAIASQRRTASSLIQTMTCAKRQDRTSEWLRLSRFGTGRVASCGYPQTSRRLDCFAWPDHHGRTSPFARTPPWGCSPHPWRAAGASGPSSLVARSPTALGDQTEVFVARSQAMTSCMRAASASIVKGLTIICMPASRKPLRTTAFSA